MDYQSRSNIRSRVNVYRGKCFNHVSENEGADQQSLPYPRNPDALTSPSVAVGEHGPSRVPEQHLQSMFQSRLPVRRPGLPQGAVQVCSKILEHIFEHVSPTLWLTISKGFVTRVKF